MFFFMDRVFKRIRPFFFPDGGLLEVRATDPGSPDDFVAFCESTGNELVSSEETNGCFRFVIRRLR